MDIPATLAAETALTRQTIAVQVVKQAAQADRAVAGILDQALRVSPASSTRGGNIDIKV